MRDHCDYMLNPKVFSQIQAQMGACEVNQTTSTALQLETRSREGRCLQLGQVPVKGFCQPSMVLDSTLLGSGEEAESQDNNNHLIVEHSAMVSSSTEIIRGLP